MEKKKSIKFNFIMNVILSVSNILFPIITFPYLTEIIKPDGTGKIGFALSLVEYFNIFAQLGIPMYGIRVCAQVRDDKEKLTKTSHELLIINLCMTAITYVVFALSILFIPALQEERALYLIVSLNMIMTTIGMEWLYKAMEDYKYITIRSVIFKFIALIAMFLLVHDKEDYRIYGAISVLATSGSMIVNFFNIHKYIDLKPRKNYDFKRHIKPVGIFLAMGCATTVYTNLDTIMLKLMTTDVDTGYYYTSIKVKSVLLSIITSLGAVLLPRVSFYVENKMMDEFKFVITKAIKFVLIVSMAATFFFMLTARPCIMFLAKGDFEGAIMPMKIIVPTVFLIGLSNIFGIQILVPLKKEKTLLYILTGGAVLDFVINIILIPRLRASGAAVGTLAAECLVTGALLIYLSKDLKGVFARLEIIKIIIPLIISSVICAGSYYLLITLDTNGNLPAIITGYGRIASLFKIAIPFGIFSIIYLILLIVMKESLTMEILNRFLKRKGQNKDKSESN